VPRTRRPLRIPPLPEDEQDEQAKELLAPVLVDGRALNIFTTLVRHPRLFRRWSPFGGMLLRRGELSARDRELLILRTGWHCQSEYEWAQHVDIAREAGLSETEIARVPEGPVAPGWSPLERALLEAADELHRDSCIGPGTWEVLAANLTIPQLIEVCMVVGQYHLVAYTLNSLGVELEAGGAPFPGEEAN